MAKMFLLAELGFGEKELLPLNHWSSGIGALTLEQRIDGINTVRFNSQVESLVGIT